MHPRSGTDGPAYQSPPQTSLQKGPHIPLKLRSPTALVIPDVSVCPSDLLGGQI